MNIGHFISLTPLTIATLLSINVAEVPETKDEPPSISPVVEVIQAAEPVYNEATIENDEFTNQLDRNKHYVRTFGEAAFGKDEVPALMEIVQRESGFKNNAQNPKSTAYGMFQFLNSTWVGYGYQKTSDPIIQTEAGISYIKARYGSPSNALGFHNRMGWY